MIKYKELSLPLRISVLGGWLVFFGYCFYIILIIVGFIAGFFWG